MMYLDRIKTLLFIKRSSIVLLLFYLMACSSQSELHQYTFSGRTMGTTYNIKIINKFLDATEVSNIETAIDSSLKKVNQQMSTYLPDSEISLFNKYDKSKPFEISLEFSKVIKEAMRINKISSGAFDITVNPLVNLWGFGSKSKETIIPDEEKINNVLKRVGSEHITIIDKNKIKKSIPDLEIDLSAIAKGYGVDVVTQVLNIFNLENYMVEIGGEVFAKGNNFQNEKWKIGIDKPNYLALPGQELQNILSISNVAVATSGDYRNFFKYKEKIYSHTINPKTGKPVTHSLASVTIVAPTCMEADGLATAVLVMGVKDGMKMLEKLPNIEGFLIDRKGVEKFEVYSTSGFNQYIN